MGKNKKSATKVFGILTAGGDCPGLNAAIRGVCRAAYDRYGMTIVGIANGYRGLIEENVRILRPEDFSGILTRGGTILGASREKPFKPSAGDTEDVVEKVEAIRENYRRLNLDCLVVLGGNGTNTTGYRLAREGLNVVG
ncbi:MAG: 6-phosphofructokinase, partial [Treponema sp.]|nr:6-phosphofructokinase [Treponema sp.]